MGVGKGGVNLNGTAVALHGSSDILHLFECVAHVAIGICKVGVDSEQKNKNK